MDIEIFPHRLLHADTTEKLLNDLEDLEGVNKMVVHGPRLPPVEEGHPDRRTIIVHGEKVELQVKTGRVLLDIDQEETIDEIKEICQKNISFGFNVHVGTFIRKQKTVTDELKYGDKLSEIPEEMVGMTDQNAKLSERATIIKKDE
jgi:methyl-coenzyme M reductase subunit D